MRPAEALTTARLRLLALTAGQLRLYLVDPRQLEEDLALKPSLGPAGQALRRAIGLKLAAMAEVDEALHGWLTYWLIVVQAQHIAAGLVGFKGAPDGAGHVEIGYGIEEAFRGHGYATEAVSALVGWAFTSPACLAVTARTRPDNDASMAVLRKAGFGRAGLEDEELLWQLERGTHDVETN